MIILDMRTIVFSNVVTAIVCLLVILALWHQSRTRFQGTGFWLADFALQTVALFLIVLRGRIPDAISMVLANSLVIIGALLGYMGLEQFVQKPRPQTFNWILIAIFIGVLGYYSLIQPSLAARNLYFSITLGIICFQCAWLLTVRVEPGMRRLTLGVGLVFGAYCLVSLIRIAEVFLITDSTNDYFQPGTFEPAILVTYQTLFILLTYSLILMVNKRLLTEVMTQEEKFSKAFHSSPYAIILTRLSDGQIMEVNTGFLAITGYLPEDVLGKTTVDLHIWDQETDRNAVVEELFRTGMVHGLEFRFRKKSGEILTGIFSAEIIRINREPCILSSIDDMSERKQNEMERERLIHDLQDALAKVKQLSGFLPICASCKKIRDDQGYWTQIETYVREHSEAEFSHGICPECMARLYPEYAEYPENTLNSSVR